MKKRQVVTITIATTFKINQVKRYLKYQPKQITKMNTYNNQLIRLHITEIHLSQRILLNNINSINSRQLLINAYARYFENKRTKNKKQQRKLMIIEGSKSIFFKLEI